MQLLPYVRLKQSKVPLLIQTSHLTCAELKAGITENYYDSFITHNAPEFPWMSCAKKPKQHKKMAGDEGICSSCFGKTKYTCLTCSNFFCMRCSEFEKNENTPGWKAAKSVAYCESCFNEMMERESSQSIMTKRQDEVFNEDDVTSRKSPSSTDSAEQKGIY